MAINIFYASLGFVFAFLSISFVVLGFVYVLFLGRLISGQVEMLLTFTSCGFNSSAGGCFGQQLLAFVGYGTLSYKMLSRAQDFMSQGQINVFMA